MQHFEIHENMFMNFMEFNIVINDFQVIITQRIHHQKWFCKKIYVLSLSRVAGVH